MIIWNDLRYSIRSFARTPLSTIALVLTIGLGVGANAVVDGFIRGLSTVTPANEMTREMATGLVGVSALLRAVATAVFVIACANVVSLLLSRASARSRETSVRVALGVSRGQLTRQLLADSLVIAVAGGIVGALLTAWTTMLVPVLFFEEDAEQLVFAPDTVGILVIIAIGIVSTMSCGALPMFELRHDQPSRVLQKENAGSSARMRALRTSLVMMQLALCCVLIVSMAVLVQGLDAALETRVAHRLGTPILVTTQARAFDSPFETAEVGLDYFQRVEKAARAVGPIFDAAWTSRPPGNRPSSQPFRIEPPDLPTRERTLDAVAHETPLQRTWLSTFRVPIPPEAAEVTFDTNAVSAPLPSCERSMPISPAPRLRQNALQRRSQPRPRRSHLDSASLACRERWRMQYACAGVKQLCAWPSGRRHGASPGRVFADGVRLAAGEALIGAIAAFFVARWVTQITGNQQSIPWSVWSIASALLVAAVAVASVFPARDAVTVDPLSLMRK